MWIILGICSLISTIINVKKRVLLEDWSAILDVVPSMTTVLIIYTIIIVTINVVALWNFFNKIKCYHKKTGFPVFL